MEVTMLSDLNVHEVSLVKRGANQGAKLALIKHHKEDENMEELEQKIQELTKALEDAQSEIEKSNTSLEEAQATIAELSKEEAVEEEVEKAELPESVRKELEEAKEVAKEFAQFKADAVVEKLTGEVAKHSSVFKSDEDKQKAVDVLKSMTEDERAFIFDTIAKSAQILEEAAETISQEVGKNGDNDVKVTDMVIKEAKDLCKSNDNMTFEVAKVEVVTKLSAEDRAKYDKGE